MGQCVVAETTTLDSVTLGVFCTVLSNVLSTSKGVILGAMEGCNCGVMIALDSGTMGLGVSTLGCGMVLVSFKISLLVLTLSVVVY